MKARLYRIVFLVMTRHGDIIIDDQVDRPRQKHQVQRQITFKLCPLISFGFTGIRFYCHVSPPIYNQ